MTALARALWQALTAPGRRWCSAAAAAGVALALWLPASSALPALCGAPLRALWSDWEALLGPAVTPAALALAWLVMLLAMMPPLLGEPMRHVWFASLPRRRAWAVALFTASYACVWMVAAPALMLLAWISSGVMGTAAVAVVLGVAVAWSSAPWTQRARNRCHRVCRIGAQGVHADGECIAYGARFATQCAIVCWPWMIVPLLVEKHHVAAMVAVALWLTLDRLSAPRAAAWQRPPVLDYCTSRY